MAEIVNLKSFVWIARLGSFCAAAEKLNAAQPSISARIQKLEEEFGTRLFDRSRRQPGLTRKGQELLTYAESLLRLHDDMVRAVADPATVAGTVRLGVAETIVYTWLPDLIDRLNRTYPHAELDLEVDASVNLRDKLVRRDLDLALLRGPVSEPSIENQWLCRYPLAWVASPMLGLPQRQLTLAELAAWPILTYPRHSRPNIALQERLAHVEGVRPRLFSCGSLSTVVRMTQEGMGISVIPPRIIQDDLAAGRLALLASDTGLPALEFTASYHGGPDGYLARSVAEMAGELAAGERNSEAGLR